MEFIKEPWFVIVCIFLVVIFVLDVAYHFVDIATSCLRWIGLMQRPPATGTAVPDAELIPLFRDISIYAKKAKQPGLPWEHILNLYDHYRAEQVGFYRAEYTDMVVLIIALPGGYRMMTPDTNFDDKFDLHQTIDKKFYRINLIKAKDLWDVFRRQSAMRATTTNSH